MATTMRSGTGGPNITVRLRGPLFDGKVKGSVERAIIDESLEKIGLRTERGGKGKGAKRNTIRRDRDGLTMTVHSSLNWPRTKGTSWQRKNEAIVRAMARRVLRKTAERIVRELG